MKKATAILLVFALLSTSVAVPLYSYTPAIYGRPSIMDMGFVKDYIVSWWRKVVRRYIYGELGPAENVSADQQQAEQYTLPTTKTSGEPTDIYELLNYMEQNKVEYSTQILDYLEQNNIPNKSAQLDLLIVPENIYVTFTWNELTLEVYDGWIGDQNYKEYVVATATSELMMNLYENRNNIETAKNLILDAEANGEISYTLKRINPTLAEWIVYLQLTATIFSIVGWMLFFSEKLHLKGKSTTPLP